MYKIFPDGDSGTKTKLELTAVQFVQAGIDIDSIYIINENEFNLYATLDPITTPEEYQTRTAPASTPAEEARTNLQLLQRTVNHPIPKQSTDGDLIRATATNRHIHSKNNKQQTIQTTS